MVGMGGNLCQKPVRHKESLQRRLPQRSMPKKKFATISWPATEQSGLVTESMAEPGDGGGPPKVLGTP